MLAFLPACLLNSMCACLSVCLSACFPVCLPSCLSSSAFECLPACISVCLFLCLYVYLSVCPSLFLPVCLSARLSSCMLPACLPFFPLTVCLYCGSGLSVKAIACGFVRRISTWTIPWFCKCRKLDFLSVKRAGNRNRFISSFHCSTFAR